MSRKLLTFVLEQRLVIVALVGLLIGGGIWAAIHLPIDAVPDVTNVQVQINTASPALSPLEIEQQITTPIELAMGGLPGLEEVRSVSKFGLSQVTVIFHDDVNIYFARQLVQERLQAARENIAPGLGTPQMGPIATGLGDVLQYYIDSPGMSLIDARTLQDWVIKPQLRTVPGVADVSAFGGYERQYQVIIRPEDLVKYGLTLRNVFEAIAQNNMNAGGGYILKGAEQYAIRGLGRVQSVDEIRNIFLRSKDGVAVRVQDVANVQIGGAIRQGAVSKDGQGEIVSGITMMLVGSNSRTVVQQAKDRLTEIERTLPQGVRLKVFYDRGELVDRTIHTVERNLFEGGLLVVVILLLVLDNVRAAFIVALAIPLSMLFAVSMMVRFGIAGSLMSLGAIDFGLIVDGSVVMVENTVRRLSSGGQDADFLDTIREGCAEVARPIIFGVGIIIIVYLPILTLEGVEGKLFRPMALTVVFALLGSLLMTFTATPVLMSLLLKRGREETEPFLMRKAKAAYEPILNWSLTNGRIVLAVAVIAVIGVSLLIPFLGSEFVPRLDEGAIAIGVLRLPSVSLAEAISQATMLEKTLLEKFPDEISTVVSKTGRAEIAADPMGPEMSDVFVELKPREQWKRARTKAELERVVAEECRRIPGLNFTFSQPIELRVNELVAGVRSDLAIRLYGDDLDTLRRKADEVLRAVQQIAGASDFKVQQISGLPSLEIVIDQNKIARYGINSSQVMEVVEAISGLETSTVLEGQRRFELVIKLPETAAHDVRTISSLIVTGPHGERVPLAGIATIREVEGPAEIGHLNGSRLIVVEGNVRGRDIGGFVGDVRKLFQGKVTLLPGYRPEFGGQFENLERARTRLFIVVPLALFLILLLLFTTFNSLRHALLVFTGVPLAALGGVLSLLLRGMPFSISAGVGFIALFGVAVLNGLVMVSYINSRKAEGAAVRHAVLEGAMTRLRPVLMTALVASLGFIPMAVSNSSGAEVQRPLATVVIGGLVSSTILTLLVLPVLYEMIENGFTRRGEARR
jgi:cobalt-zinc-cadmium resistance protein CzcA